MAEPTTERGKVGNEGEGVAGSEPDGSEPEYGFDWTRNELVSRGMAGRGAANLGSRNPGPDGDGRLKSGRSRAGWGRAALPREETVARPRCWKAGKSVVTKYWSILWTRFDAGCGVSGGSETALSHDG